MERSSNVNSKKEAQVGAGGWWKAGGRFLAVLLIPIEKDTGGGVEGQLVGLLKAAPAIFVRFLIQSDICL
jgi:hypothetical protein